MGEIETMKHIQANSMRYGTKLFRNNVGRLRDERGRYVQFGLGVGTSDLVGYKTKKITVDMVGTTVAVFTAIEVKHGYGKPTLEQSNFLNTVNRDGGIATVCYSAEEAFKKLENS